VDVDILENADNLDGWWFIVAFDQQLAVGEELVVDVDGVILQHAVLRRLRTRARTHATRARIKPSDFRF